MTRDEAYEKDLGNGVTEYEEWSNTSDGEMGTLAIYKGFYIYSVYSIIWHDDSHYSENCWKYIYANENDYKEKDGELASFVTTDFKKVFKYIEENLL